MVMIETKFTFMFKHPTDSDLVVFLVKNTATCHKKTGRKYGLDWYLHWDATDKIPPLRREFTERVLVKDYYDIVDMIKYMIECGINFGGEESLFKMLNELKQF
jgi:hypothetical protein